jgi:lipid A disaccharide synthetase
MKTVVVIPMIIEYKLKKVQVVYFRSPIFKISKHGPNIVHVKLEKVPSPEKQRQHALNLRKKIEKVMTK